MARLSSEFRRRTDEFSGQACCSGVNDGALARHNTGGDGSWQDWSPWLPVTFYVVEAPTEKDATDDESLAEDFGVVRGRCLRVWVRWSSVGS